MVVINDISDKIINAKLKELDEYKNELLATGNFFYIYKKLLYNLIKSKP
jgi:hypothetical protein